MGPFDADAPASPLAAAAPSDTVDSIVTITPAALEVISGLRAEEADPDSLGLRLAIASAPGEDFRYDLSFDEYLTAAFTDEVRTIDGLKIIVPADSV
jgi:Fe/S biogenesis protein NfuA